MSLLVRMAAVVALALAPFPLLGCGGTEIDASKAAALVEENLEKQQKQKVSSVECPSGVAVSKGETFECTVTLADGETETATLKILDSDADLELADLQPAK